MCLWKILVIYQFFASGVCGSLIDVVVAANSCFPWNMMTVAIIVKIHTAVTSSVRGGVVEEKVSMRNANGFQAGKCTTKSCQKCIYNLPRR